MPTRAGEVDATAPGKPVMAGLPEGLVDDPARLT